METQQERSAAVKPMQAPGVRFLQTVTMSFSANPLLAAFGQRRGFRLFAESKGIEQAGS
ncbi:hypothetical protein OZ411_07935 [Bradyrhizobium sp. Arg237L]|uniref:hypothetical protein n=1 Tax=Bradyrhizobium sp. Arg237L TaxID=3003352 RepID=UPI00249EE477|nr:hypothetical protein [Bradyrhizobium sp. Arg237L]MDI4232738.1 hypothetical protein [Bradyrhizobium sp. Arg237L]